MATEPIKKVTARGRTRYRVIVDVGIDPATGRRKQVCSTHDTKKAAQLWLAETRAQAAKGTFVGRERTTVDAYLDEWLAGKRDLKPTTKANYTDALKVARRSFGHKALQDLTKADLDRMVNGMLDGSLRRQGRTGQPLSARAVRLTLTVVSMALESAVKEGRLARNVAAMVERPGNQTKARGVWNGGHMAAFLKVSDADRLGGAWRLTMQGLRRGEVLGLSWEDVDLDAATVTVHRNRVAVGSETILQTTKTAAGRRVLALTPGAVTALKRMKAQQAQERLQAGALHQDTGLVAVDALGEPVKPRWYGDRFKALARDAGVPVVRLHDARHAYGSHLLDQGVPLTIVSEVLGHASVDITASVYAHAVNDDTTHDRVRQAAVAAGL